MATISQVARDEFVDQLEEWGYEPFRMAQSNAAEDGYDYLVLDEDGHRVLKADSEGLVTFRRAWDGPDHWLFVRGYLLGLEAGRGV